MGWGRWGRWGCCHYVMLLVQSALNSSSGSIPGKAHPNQETSLHCGCVGLVKGTMEPNCKYFMTCLYKCQRDWQNLQCLHWQWESSVSSLAMATSKSLGLRLKHRLVVAAVTVACSTVPLVCRNFSCTWNRWKWTQPRNWRLICCKSASSPIFLVASRCKCWHVRCSCLSASLTAYLFQLSSGPGPCWFAAVAVATVAVATVAVADTVSPVQSRASPVSRVANVKKL